MTDTVFDQVSDILNSSPYQAVDKLPLFKALILKAAQNNPDYKRYVQQWPIAVEQASEIYQLPYLPVSLFKSDASLNLVADDKIFRILFSSATTGTKPSRIPLDRETTKRMTKGTLSIMADFIGSQRRPYLVIDLEKTNARDAQLSARAAAIRGLQPFASETHYFLSGEDETLNIDELVAYADKNKGTDVLIYGFTYLIWSKLVEPLKKRGINLGLENAFVVHSGGWKKLVSMAVDKPHFNDQLAQVVGCSEARIIDYYGMVENLGVIYPDCPHGNKHVAGFADVCIRSPLTLEPVEPGETGIVQVSSMLPSSFPGYCLLTEDLAQVVSYEKCPCGRPGLAFRFAGRIPKAEIRGCGDVIAHRVSGAEQ
jgi:phenylacetate-coenzyme A ligase PaaK-like adenylate-forming protein